MPLARVDRHTCSQGQADGMKMRALESKSTLEMRAICKTRGYHGVALSCINDTVNSLAPTNGVHQPIVNTFLSLFKRRQKFKLCFKLSDFVANKLHLPLFFLLLSLGNTECAMPSTACNGQPVSCFSSLSTIVVAMVTFPLAVTKCPDTVNLREKEFKVHRQNLS